MIRVISQSVSQLFHGPTPRSDGKEAEVVAVAGRWEGLAA